MSTYGKVRRLLSYGFALFVLLLAWLVVQPPATAIAAAAEGSVSASITLECTDSLINPTVRIRADVSNGTEGSVSVTTTIFGSVETKSVPAGSSVQFPQDSGQKSVEAGLVAIETSGTQGIIFYGAKNCPSDSQSYGPIELFVTPETTTPAGPSFSVPFAACLGLRVTGHVPSDATLQVVIDDVDLSTVVTAGDFDTFFPNPSQDKATVEWSVGIGTDVQSGTLTCEQEETSSSETSTSETSQTETSTSENSTSETSQTSEQSQTETSTTDGSTSDTATSETSTSEQPTTATSTSSSEAVSSVTSPSSSAESTSGSTTPVTTGTTTTAAVTEISNQETPSARPPRGVVLASTGVDGQVNWALNAAAWLLVVGAMLVAASRCRVRRS